MVLSESLPALFKQLILFLIALAGVSFLITFHELGHFLFCKLFGVRTPSFSVGFGPRLIEKKIGDTVFALSAIPMGGYVEIAGSHEAGQGEQQFAHNKAESWSFAAKPYYQKFLILMGGILFNMAFAFAALTWVFYSGAPKTPMLYPENSLAIIDSVVPGGPAEQAGLKQGDSIVKFNNIPINNNGAFLLELIKQNPDKTATLTIQHSNNFQDLTTQTGATDLLINLGRFAFNQKIGYIGASLETAPLAAVSFGEALQKAAYKTWSLAGAVASAFKMLFSRKGATAVGGPIMVIAQTVKGAASGSTIFLLLLAFISINLAVINLVPLPIFDGGQLAIYTIEALIGRPLSENLKLYIAYGCWFLILGLMVILSYKDLKNIFFS